MSYLGRLDWLGLVCWSLLWLGYSIWTRRDAARPSLMSSLARYRRVWMREAYRRDNRITDVALVGSLMQSATFFSSTTLIILGGLFALLGTIDKGAEVVQSLPFAARSTAQLIEFKAVCLTLVFVHAFLRFTWSLRQFSLVNIVIGAYPSQRDHHVQDDRLIDQASRLNELAGANFTQGLRTYYFSIPVLLWLVNPWFLVIGGFAITAASYWMEYRSATVGALSDESRP